LENVIIKFVADTSGLEPAIKQLQLLGKISEEDAAKFNLINQEQKEFIQNVNKSTTEMGKLSNEVENLTAEIQGGAINTLADGLKEVTTDTVNSAKGFKSMKAELRELKAQIASGTLGEKEMQAATRRAGELADAIEDAGRQVKAFAGSRFENILNRVGEGAKALAAGMSMVAGAQALLGTENKELEKTMLKVQASMALLQGTQELTNLLQKESALMTGLMEVKTYALSAAQRIAAASSMALGVAISESMVLATGGLAALVIGLGVLATTMDDAEEDAIKRKEKLQELQKNNEDILDKLDEARIKRMLKGRQQELQLQKLHNEKMLQEIYNQNVNEELQGKYLIELAYQNRQAIDDINKKYDDLELEAKKKLRDKIVENKKKETQDLINEQKRALREEIAANQLALESATSIDEKAFYYKKITELKKDQVRLTEDLTDSELILRLEQFDKEYEAFVKLLVDKKYAQDGYYDADLEAWAANEQAKIDAAKAAAAKQAEADKKKKKKAFEDGAELTQFTIDQARVVADTVFTIMQQNRQAIFDADMAALEEARERELDNKNLTESQRAQIEKRYKLEEARLKQQAWKQQKDADLAQAVINGALAISRAWTLGLPAAIPASIAAGVATAAQIAVIANTKPPKFADGTEFLIGAGTGRSDNNLAYLSHGERVVPASVNSDYYPALSAIHNREVEPTFANNILTALANGTFDLAAQYHQGQSKGKSTFDVEKLGKVLEKHKTNVNINIDENGFNKYVEKSNSRTEFRNAKLRIKA
jgi:hypothetical protein